MVVRWISALLLHLALAFTVEPHLRRGHHVKKRQDDGPRPFPQKKHQPHHHQTTALFGKKKYNTRKPLRSLSLAVRRRLQRDSSPFVVLVDANNVRGMDGNFRLTNYDLLRVLSIWQASVLNASTTTAEATPNCSHMVIILVMDHGILQCSSSYQGIYVVFAGPERTADDVIAEDCQWWQSQSHDVLVATSDRELESRCRLYPSAVSSNSTDSISPNKVEIFASMETSNMLRTVWNQNAKLVAASCDITTLEPLRHLECDIRVHFGHHHPSSISDDVNEVQNGDHMEVISSKPAMALGCKGFLEATWQRVLLAEQLRMLLSEEDQDDFPNANALRQIGENSRHSPELTQYRLKYRNITSQAGSIFDDARIRNDHAAQEALRQYSEKNWTEVAPMMLAGLPSTHVGVRKDHATNRQLEQ